MDRAKAGGYAELIQSAYDLIPAGFHPLLRPHFLCGTDPIFAGLHEYEDTTDGRSYRATPHVAYDFHQTGIARSNRHVTVVLPDPPKTMRVRVLVHELGHVLHERLGFEHDAVPVTEYADSSRFEGFAEAFTAWVLPLGNSYGAAKDRLYSEDPATVALFESLA